MPKLCCIAIIGKQNNPLYIRNFEQELYDDIKFHYISHTACDLFQEKALNLTKNQNQGQYFGLLHVVEEFVVYGYITNTKIKFIAVLELNDEIIKDVEMKQIHAAYIMLICNPFYNLNDSPNLFEKELVPTNRFTQQIDQIGEANSRSG